MDAAENILEMEIGMEYRIVDSSVARPFFSPKKFKVIVRAKCVRLVCFLVTATLFVGGASSELAYSNAHKNPEEVVQFLLNRKPKILLQWTPHIDQKIKLAVRGGCSNASSDYKWLSSDIRILDVSSYGVIQAKRPGIATVIAVSTCDPHNFDEIVVKVFSSQDVCYDMDPKHDNDLSEPIYVSKPKPKWKACLTRTDLVIFLVGGIKWKACLRMTDLVIFLVGGILAIACSYCCCRYGSVRPINRCSKNQLKGSSMRRIRRYRR